MLSTVGPKTWKLSIFLYSQTMADSAQSCRDGICSVLNENEKFFFAPIAIAIYHNVIRKQFFISCTINDIGAIISLNKFFLAILDFQFFSKPSIIKRKPAELENSPPPN